MLEIWHIILIVCLNGRCMQQEVATFGNLADCKYALVEYLTAPTDGNFDTVTYLCKSDNTIAL